MRKAYWFAIVEPEGGELICRGIVLCRVARSLPQGEGVRGAIGMAEPARVIKHHSWIAP